jgi:dihydrofolate synthase/folylpolyglutamate synthase
MESQYEKALKILTSQEKFHINLGLERVQELLAFYGNPQNKIKCIHVAGTNGKGSTCAMLDSVLREAGYKTGLYTSPHLVDYTERIKINGSDISKDDFAKLLFEIYITAEVNKIQATEFEILTVMMYVFFERQKVDFAIVETGLGGRLDATNVIEKPLVSIITTIDLDHTDRLGDTIDLIAAEKAGIIKSGVSVVVNRDNLGLEVIKEKAAESNSILEIADDSTQIEYEVALEGTWQKKNLALVLKTIEVLQGQNIKISEDAVKRALKIVSWSGRFQYIKEKNLILDGAHNPSAAKVLRETLDEFYADKKRIWIYSSISSKDYKEVMEILFHPEDIVILSQSNAPAAVPAEILLQNMAQEMLVSKIFITKNLKEAMNIYSGFISDKNIGIMAGSLYTIGDFLAEFK